VIFWSDTSVIIHFEGSVGPRGGGGNGGKVTDRRNKSPLREIYLGLHTVMSGQKPGINCVAVLGIDTRCVT